MPLPLRFFLLYERKIMIMKKTVKLISALLVLVLSVTALSSCGLYFSFSGYPPKGYTGGFGISPGQRVEYHWVETYEEVQAAIELLSSHGSTFYKSAFFNYDGELFDTKYCFEFCGKMESVEKGSNPFDRKIELVVIRAYGFLEDVTIEELEYSYVHSYDVIYLLMNSEFDRRFDTADAANADLRLYKEYYPIVRSDNVPLFSIRREKRTEDIKLSDEQINAVFDSLVFIGEFTYFN